MGKSGDQKMRVTQYNASVHYGICHGPVDSITKIIVKEKVGWTGLQSSQGPITVNNKNLFGGNKKEGGIQGLAEYLPGGPTQVIPEVLAAKVGLTSATMPAYRGIASVFFYGRKFVDPAYAGDVEGFYWTANNPYLPGVWVTVSRTPSVPELDPAYVMPAAGNPSHIIYECLTNAEWGMGAASTAIDIPSFDRAASTLLDESFSLSMMWTRQTTIEAFVGEVLDHIEATLFVNPRTGLLTLKLIREELGQIIDLSAVSNGASDPTGGLSSGVTIAAQPNQTISFSLPTGETYVAYSPWGVPSPANAPGHTGSLNTFRVIRDGDISDVTTFGAGVHDGYEAARAAFTGGEISGGSSYTFYIQDTPLDDNTGGLSIRIDRVYHHFTPLNCTVTNFQRKLWGELPNEIVVTWTDPTNEEERTVSVQDLANIAVQGGTISDGRNYYGVRDKNLATALAQRDLRSASAPLASCDIFANREAWDLLPGDICLLTSPEDGVDSIYMRVGPVDYGLLGDAKIRASLVEDVFSRPLAQYTIPPDSLAEPTSEEPAPAADTYIFTLPLFMVGTEVTLTTTTDVEYPTVFAGILVSQIGQDTTGFELIGELLDAAGNPYIDSLGTLSIASRSELAEALVAEPQTTVLDFPGRTKGPGPQAGGFVIFESEESESEIALVVSFTDGIGYVLNRGVLDTVPRAWPIGTPVWFVTPSINDFGDSIERSDGETVEYQILTITSMGVLDESLAPVVDAVLTGRPHLPLRPADIEIAGVGYGLADARPFDPIVPVTWATRNRLTEDAIVLAWTDATVTPEVGQLTRITVSHIDGTVLAVHDDLIGTSFDIPVASFDGNSIGLVKVESVRDGLVSLQGYEMAVLVEPAGYGYSYGYNYGGA